jgi:hypothetical protein
MVEEPEDFAGNTPRPVRREVGPLMLQYRDVPQIGESGYGKMYPHQLAWHDVPIVMAIDGKVL